MLRASSASAVSSRPTLQLSQLQLFGMVISYKSCSVVSYWGSPEEVETKANKMVSPVGSSERDKSIRLSFYTSFKYYVIYTL